MSICKKKKNSTKLKRRKIIIFSLLVYNIGWVHRILGTIREPSKKPLLNCVTKKNKKRTGSEEKLSFSFVKDKGNCKLLPLTTTQAFCLDWTAGLLFGYL